MGQVRLEPRSLHSQDLLPRQQHFISEKENLLSLQGLVIPVHPTQNSELSQKGITTTFPPKYLTAQTNQVLE